MRRTTIGALVLSLALLPAVCRGAEDLLSVLPEKALAVVRLNRLAETDAKLAEFSRHAQVPAPGLLALFKAQAGVQQGLDEKGSAALVVMAADDNHEEPAVILFVPVTDYGKFLAPIKRGELRAGISQVEIWGSSFIVRKLGPYAVFAEPRHDDVLEKELTPGGLAKELAPLAAFLEENDVSAVATHRGIHLVVELILEQMEQIKAVFHGAGEQGAAVTKVFEVNTRLLKAIDRETAALAAGVRFQKQGAVCVSVRVRLAPQGSAAAALAGIGKSPEDLLGGLPGGPYVLAFGTVLPKGLYQGLFELYREMMKGLAGMSEDRLTEMLKSSLEMMNSTHSQAMVLQAGKAGPLYRDVVAVMKVDDAKKFLDAYEKQIRSYRHLGSIPGVPIMVSAESRRLQIQGLPALEVTMTLPTALFGPMQQVMEKLFDQGGRVTTYAAAVDQHTVAVWHANKAAISSLLEARKDPKKALTADALLGRTRAMLPKDALAVMYWSPSGTSAFVNRTLKVFGETPGVPKSVPEFPATPPVGFAVRTAPAEIQWEMVAPAEVTRAVVPYAMKVMMTIEQR